MKMRQTMNILLLSGACLLAGGWTSCAEDDPMPSASASVPAAGEGEDGGGAHAPAAGTDGSPDGTADGDPDGTDDNGNKEEQNMDRNITIQVGGKTFSATLADNEAARAFRSRLPLTLGMSDLNANEKYAYLAEPLPVAPVRPGTIRPGDLMLYGSSCVVLFYDTFSSGYSYTRLGQIDRPGELAAAVGRGSVRVTFGVR